MVPSPGNRTSNAPPVFDAGPFDPLEAYRWGFAVLRAEPQRIGVPLVVAAFAMVMSATLVPSLINGLVGLVVGHATVSPLASVVRALGNLVGAGFALVVTAYLSTGVYPLVLNVARGRPIQLTDLLAHRAAFNRALVLLVVTWLIVLAGSAVCLLPGVYAVVVTSMAMPLLLDRDLSVGAALRGSFELSREHWAPVGVLCLLGFAAFLAGMLLCFAGAVFVSIPVIFLAQAYAYLRLHGETPVFA